MNNTVIFTSTSTPRTNGPNSLRMLSARFPESIRHVLGPFGVFGKHTEPSTSKFSFRMHQELDACFPGVFRTCNMLLECFPNTSRIHMDATFGWSMKIIFNMHNKFLELPNAVPYASVRSRTASMLLEHTECFPNMIRSLPEHPNSYSENKRNGIQPNVIGP
ncbi:hypothetical protein GWK47_023570 [Chionoecetes opilio]|uniref:Uncharacterized protein n=1 Tax=Chionoecetes opilio TaxID=41210 RepID=A0A8J4XW64_CHIOP|nr:hypothetical protein GWK47_023570 [Chionoecetes opilio]